ncbi:hypothetical protein Asppvi_011369 [Aspergillus pseudoviridinutans]|uniref:Uncharacterized protein n=1 Tax=Aspergillus pseudoviridinutans TaxID=1517512 RepID=A0A9P3BJC6_9EURO|nr:uncharacterized protein Asppvi_011369 [Aspergillus pseudoviridinutans]GIJ92387.1 hypothetical protein Asppvi_011369 [Aspergillus pseudoviridinutans]
MAKEAIVQDHGDRLVQPANPGQDVRSVLDDPGSATTFLAKGMLLVYSFTKVGSIRLELSPIGPFLAARMALALVMLDIGLLLVVIPVATGLISQPRILAATKQWLQ